jgi:two-component system OmpR family sensor kinase
MTRRFLVILSPLVLGILASLLARAFFNPVPVLVFRIDAGMVLFVFGAFLTLLLTAVETGKWLRQREASRQVEASRHVAQESRRRFIRRLDHEIKNPLTGLQAALANLSEASSADDRLHAAGNAHRSVERLSHLLADLRKLSDLGERPLEQLPVDVPALLAEMVEAARSLPAYASREIGLLIARVPPLPAVIGDRDLLGLAFYNLIDNALKFTGASDPVEVRALENGRQIVVEVADSGPGIAADDLPNVFEELYRGANARGVEGSGLGLALVQRIIALHGGEIVVRSRREGAHGTVFTLRLPVVRA